MAAIDWSKPYHSSWYKELMATLDREYWQKYPIKYFSAESVGSKITGNSATCILIDDPINEGANMKLTKPMKKTYNTIGVRFIYGPALHKVYTYRVVKGAKLHLGQEVVVPSTHDFGGEQSIKKTVAVVVEIHKTPQDNGPFNYLYVEGTIKAL